jgi:hypothetical protein
MLIEENNSERGETWSSRNGLEYLKIFGGAGRNRTDA